MENKNDNGSNGEVYNNEHESTITKCLGETWRLFVGKQIVFPGDKIIWHAKNSDLLFGLPEDSKNYFALEKGEFEEKDDNKEWPYKEEEGMYDSHTYVQYVEKGGSLILRVREDCFNSDSETPPGGRVTIFYDIFVIDDREFVVGNSSPSMIIQRPYSN